MFPKIFFLGKFFWLKGADILRKVLNSPKKRSTLSILVSKGIGVGIFVNPLMSLADTVKTRHLMTAKDTLTGHLRLKREKLSSEMPHEENHHDNDEIDYADNNPDYPHVGTELFDWRKRHPQTTATLAPLHQPPACLSLIHI